MRLKLLLMDARAMVQGEKALKHILINLGKILLIFLVTVLLTELLRARGASNANLIMVYLLSVAIVSYILPTYVYGILAALASTFVYDYLITDPRMEFSFNTGIPITLFTMLVVTFIISTLTTQAKTQALLSIEREQRAELLREINQKLLAARDIQTIVKVTNDYLLDHLGCPVAFYTGDPHKGGRVQTAFPGGGSAEALTGETQQKRVHTIFEGGPSPLLPRGGDSGDNITYIPVESRGRVMLSLIHI